MWYGAVLMTFGRIEKAIEELNRAKLVDPLSALTHAAAGFYLFQVREYDLSLSFLEDALETNPSFPMARWAVGLHHEQERRLQEAVGEYQEALRSGASSAVFSADLGRVCALMGDRARALEILNEFIETSKHRYVSSYHVALIYIGLDERSEALDWLERAYEERNGWMPWLWTDPRLDALRSEPRFQELIRLMNFPE
jgi:tetratricopeptide (TPR) repeat protein